MDEGLSLQETFLFIKVSDLVNGSRVSLFCLVLSLGSLFLSETSFHRIQFRMSGVP